MAKQSVAGVVPVGLRRVWAGKEELLAGGALVIALEYSRASSDPKGHAKSCGDQRKLNIAEASVRSWTLRDEHLFKDNDRSASRYARKEREEFPKLVELIKSGVGDVLIMFELARGQRDLAVYVELRDLCIAVGLNFWLLGGRLYDLRDRYDRQSLNNQAMQAEDLSEGISENVQRGINGAAAEGRPAGITPYGYVREYDKRTKALLGQYPDNEVLEATAADGVVTQYSRAGVIRDIYRLVAKGKTLKAVATELNRRGVPSPGGKTWRSTTVRAQVLNPAYAAKRVLRGAIATDGIWEPLVDDEVFWAVAERLSDPERRTRKPGKSKWLLSYWVTCGECGGEFEVKAPKKSKDEPNVRYFKYICRDGACSSVAVKALEEYVHSAAVAYLSRDDVAELLRATTAAGNEAAARARAEVSRLNAELESWRRLADTKQVAAVSFARAEKPLLAAIAEAEAASGSAGVPESLRDLIGPDAPQKWAALRDANDIVAMRDVLKRIMTISVAPAGRRRVPLDQRVSFGGPIAGQPL